ncbi:MAG: ABC transporter permease [Clostridiales bacterium]|nr:ABC transporter permease [Clostridiales bacterium]
MEEMKRTHPVKTAMEKLFQNKLATICFFFLIAEIILVLLAPVIAPYSYEEQDATIKLRPGIWAVVTAETDESSPDYDPQELYVPGHILGTDNFGRDVFSRLLYGGRISLMVGFVSTFMGLAVGVICGMLAGYYKRLDNPIMRVMDLLFTFPGILLAMLVIAMLGVNTFNTMLAISIWSIPSFARMVRGKVLQIKEEDYIMATRSLGAKDSRILLVHVLRNCMPIIIVIATMRMATSIISISTLSYLGMGVTPPMPEWGGMIAAAKEYLWKRPSLVFVPGCAVMLTVICFNILGDKLRDILDPSLRD